MFSESKSSGKHMIIDIKDIKNKELIEDVDKLKEIMKQICIDYSFQILHEIQHSFTPEGCSIILLLSESHMTIHTFPEKNYIAFDLYTCRVYPDNTDYMKIHDFLMEQLNAGESSVGRILDREF
jgi:S-adenosylmethionine decarboxylase